MVAIICCWCCCVTLTRSLCITHGLQSLIKWDSVGHEWCTTHYIACRVVALPTLGGGFVRVCHWETHGFHKTVSLTCAEEKKNNGPVAVRLGEACLTHVPNVICVGKTCMTWYPSSVLSITHSVDLLHWIEQHPLGLDICRLGSSNGFEVQRLKGWRSSRELPAEIMAGRCSARSLPHCISFLSHSFISFQLSPNLVSWGMLGPLGLLAAQESLRLRAWTEKQPESFQKERLQQRHVNCRVNICNCSTVYYSIPVTSSNVLFGSWNYADWDRVRGTNIQRRPTDPDTCQPTLPHGHHFFRTWNFSISHRWLLWRLVTSPWLGTHEAAWGGPIASTAAIDFPATKRQAYFAIYSMTPCYSSNLGYLLLFAFSMLHVDPSHCRS